MQAAQLPVENIEYTVFRQFIFKNGVFHKTKSADYHVVHSDNRTNAIVGRFPVKITNESPVSQLPKYREIGTSICSLAENC